MKTGIFMYVIYLYVLLREFTKNAFSESSESVKITFPSVFTDYTVFFRT